MFGEMCFAFFYFLSDFFEVTDAAVTVKGIYESVVSGQLGSRDRGPGASERARRSQAKCVPVPLGTGTVFFGYRGRDGYGWKTCQSRLGLARLLH